MSTKGQPEKFPNDNSYFHIKVQGKKTIILDYAQQGETDKLILMMEALGIKSIIVGKSLCG